MDIRLEEPKDRDAVYTVNTEAFGRENEANLVDRLRKAPATISLVAVKTEQIVGHIFFSPVEIAGHSLSHLFMLGLAPLAVRPNYQKQGIGSLLIRQGLEQCIRLGCKAVFVLGDPNYYARFGFVPAKENKLRCEYAGSDESFMVLELVSGTLNGCSGTRLCCIN
jgi:putative acetyltransferase